ncbi:MAG: DMT family transporter [Pseudomonadota bacterium]
MNLQIQSFSKPQIIGILATISAAIIFGVYPPAAKAAYQEGANIIFIVLITTICRMAALNIAVLIKRHKIFKRKEDYKFTVLAGVCQALSVIGIFGASYYLPGAVVIIIMFTYSLMLLAFSAFKNEIKLNVVNIGTTIFALIGLGLVLKVYEYSNIQNIIGISLAFMAALTTFARTYIYGQQGRKRNPLTVGAESFIVASLCVLLLMFWEMPEIPSSQFGITMTALCVAASVLGTFGMFYGVAMLGPYHFSMLMKLEPVFTTIFGILLIGDLLSLSQYFGIAVVLISLISLQLFDRQKT